MWFMTCVAVILVALSAPAEAAPAQCQVHAITSPNNLNVDEVSVVNGVRGPTVITLDASGSYAKTGNNDTVPITSGFEWTQKSSDTYQVTLSDRFAAKPTFTAPDVGPLGYTLHFEVKVTGPASCGDTPKTAQQNVGIANVMMNSAPTASFTATPATGQTGDTFTLNATASGDVDGDPLTYDWTQTSGTQVVLVVAGDPRIATFTAPEVPLGGETLEFQLTVSDGNLSNTTKRSVTVEHVNKAPVARVTCDSTVDEGASFLLDGSASSDAEDAADRLSYLWTQETGGPNASLPPAAAVTRAFSVEPAPTLTSLDHAMKFNLHVTDTGNLFSDAQCTVTVIDVTKPAVQCSSADTTKWYGTDQSVSCTASDAGSGLALQSDGAFTLSTTVGDGAETGGALTGSRWVCDNANNDPTTHPGINNCVTVGPYYFNVDKKAPQLTSCGAADGAWHNADVTLNCSYTDGGSGPATQDVILTTSVSADTEDANAAASASGAKACDAVSNCASSPADIPGNKIDKKAPTNITFMEGANASSFSNGASYYFGFVPAAPTCTATDGGSGLKACDVTGHSPKVGQQTLTATATDNVGNTSKKTLNYTVLSWSLSGFYQPVDMNGVYNTVKAGSTVPLKFQVFAGSTELTSTSTIGATFALQLVPCPNVAAFDAIDETMTSTGSTSLRYDTTARQFIYNWKTPAAGCYRLTMTTADGSSLVANFKTTGK